MANVVEVIPPFLMAAMRFLGAGIIIVTCLYLFKLPKDLSRKQLINAIIGGIFFLGIGNGGVSWALQFVDSGYTALLIAAQPLVLLIMMWIHQRKPLPLVSWIGVFLGMLGIILLVSQNELTSRPGQWLGMAIIFGCLLSWGFGSIFVSKADMPKPFLNSAIQMITGGVMLAVVSLLFEGTSFDFSQVDSRTWISLAYLTFFGSVLAFTAFNYLLTSDVSPEKVATSTYVNPIIALILGWYFRDELITLQSVIAAVILLSGVYFINTNKGKSTPQRKRV